VEYSKRLSIFLVKIPSSEFTIVRFVLLPWHSLSLTIAAAAVILLQSFLVYPSSRHKFILSIRNVVRCQETKEILIKYLDPVCASASAAHGIKYSHAASL
jgi:hypothetical protein